MKSKLLLLSMVTAVAVSLPMAGTCQVAPDRAPKEVTGPVYKNEAFLGWGYTSINMVSQSRSGLQGVAYGVSRNFNEHFGATFDGGYYKWNLTATNPIPPTINMYLAGPVVRGALFGKVSGFARGLIGGVSLSGVQAHPGTSFAGGGGLGLDYNHSARLVFRLQGDYIGSAFTVQPYQPGYSTHLYWNARVGVGAVYRF